MALKPHSKDYLLSSTPLQSPGDSGYFGSGQRRNNANVLNSCSPIQELTNLSKVIHLKHNLSPQLKQNLNFENLIQNGSLSNIEVNELSELEFASSNFSCQFELHKTSQSSREGSNQISNVQSKSNSKCTTSSYSLNSLSEDNDINYKLFDYIPSDNLCLNVFRCKNVDFIQELSKRNCYSIISSILSFLSAKELCIASCISKEWRKVILSDSKANKRRQNFITERHIFLNGPSKENRKGMKRGPTTEHKKLSDLTNFETSCNNVNIKAPSSKFDSFIRESRNSKSRLLKCPKCFYASKRLNENHYVCTHCSYKFCSSCLNPFNTIHSCTTQSQLPNIIVGSKKSKRNLRRL